MPVEQQHSGSAPESGSAPTTAQPSASALASLLALYCELVGQKIEAGLIAREVAALPDASAQNLGALLTRLGFEVALQADAKPRLGAYLLGLDANQLWCIAGIDAQGRVLKQAQGETAPAFYANTGDDALRFTSALLGHKARAGVGAPINAVTSSGTSLDANTATFGWPWFAAIVRKHRQLMSEVMIASLFLQIFALVTPLVFQVVIDKVLANRTLSTLDVLVFALVGLALFEVVLSLLRHYLFSHVTAHVDAEMGGRVFERILQLPMAYFHSRKGGDTVARMRELENARAFITGQAPTAIIDTLFAVVFLLVMYLYSPLLTLVVLVALPFFFAVSFFVTPLLRQKMEDKFALGAENQAFMVETVTSMETLKSHTVERQWRGEWNRRIAEFGHSSMEGSHVAAFTNQMVSFGTKVLTAVLLYLGAKAVIDGSLTVGGLIAFNMLAARINGPILRLAQLWQEIQQMKVSVARIADVMHAPVELNAASSSPAKPLGQSTLSFRDVSFKYRADGPEALSKLNFEIYPGEAIGIVGISGAGKTTLMRLLQRLYVPTAGAILADGQDLQSFELGALRGQLGVVAQDSVLYNRSVIENIALGYPQATRGEVIAAATLAGAHEFIQALPQQYDTAVGDRGALLSGGQRSRIAIARALVRNPSVLLFDEATAALDYESERMLHDQVADIRKNRTVIIVAHRLSTLQWCDRILVLEKGALVEVGKHNALLAQRGRYAGLYSLQEQANAA